MRNRGQILIGVVIVLIGLIFLIGAVIDVDVWTLCFPTGLILLGIWLLLRPQLIGPETAPGMRIFGTIRRSGSWQVTDEEHWLFVGDVILDFSEAEVPPGETLIRVSGFVGEVKARVPEGVGVSMSSSAFITDARVFDRKQDGILTPVDIASEGYETANCKIRLEMTCFIAGVKVKQV